MRRRKLKITMAAALWLAAGLSGGAATAQAPTPQYDPRTAFSETDTNKDGVVDHVEFEERMTQVFLRADSNKDGVLTSTEAATTLVETANLGKADSNHDGTLTLHEFTRARMLDYEQTDTNDDGVLELDEVVTVWEKTPQK